MICPICGFDMKEETVCEKCGFDSSETETVVDLEALEKIEVDFDEVESVENEDVISVKEGDLEVDFDEIDNKPIKKKSSKNGMFGVSIVSFIAGVLATLIVIGSLNGTIVSYIDKTLNGTPYETVEDYSDFYFQDNPTAQGMVSSFSPYLRNLIVYELESAGCGSYIDLNVDVTDDEKFKTIAQFYLDEFIQPDGQVKIVSLEFADIEYYKSGSNQFDTYLKKYKEFDNEAKGVSLFANVSFTVELEVTTIDKGTSAEDWITGETTKSKKNKKNKNKNETTVPTTTVAPKTTTRIETHNCSAICVKINDSWFVYDGMKIYKS